MHQARILRRSENIDEFSTTERLLSETPPGATERDMLQVVLDCAPLQMLTVCYEVRGHAWAFGGLSAWVPLLGGSRR